MVSITRKCCHHNSPFCVRVRERVGPVDFPLVSSNSQCKSESSSPVLDLSAEFCWCTADACAPTESVVGLRYFLPPHSPPRLFESAFPYDIFALHLLLSLSSLSLPRRSFSRAFLSRNSLPRPVFSRVPLSAATAVSSAASCSERLLALVLEAEKPPVSRNGLVTIVKTRATTFVRSIRERLPKRLLCTSLFDKYMSTCGRVYDRAMDIYLRRSDNTRLG